MTNRSPLGKRPYGKTGKDDEDAEQRDSPDEPSYMMKADDALEPVDAGVVQIVLAALLIFDFQWYEGRNTHLVLRLLMPFATKADVDKATLGVRKKLTDQYSDMWQMGKEMKPPVELMQ